MNQKTLIRVWVFFLAERIIVVTGMPGAGKDEFIKVAAGLGLNDLHMGNTVKEYARSSGIEMNDGEVGKFATGEREKHGKQIWAERTLKDLNGQKNIVIDGLRCLEELDYMRQVESELVVVAIFANRQDRLSRILKRKREDDIKDINGLIKRDMRELSWGIGSVISLADFMIVNSGSLDEFKEKSLALLHDLHGN